MFQSEIKNSCLVNKPKVVNSSFDKDSEFIDLTQDDNSVINEKEEKKEINSNNISLGKKRKRKKEKYYKNNLKNKKKKVSNDKDNNNEDKSDKSILSNNNNDNEIEKEKLLNLVKEEGFNTIFSLISNSNFDQNNPIEKELEEIINRIGLLRVTLFLIQIKFSSSSSEENKILKEKKEIENDIKNLGEHLHKEKDGKIYRYFKHYIRIRGYVFHCFDRNCKSTGLYNLENMNFKILTPHTIPYDQHIYISNKEKYEQYKDILEDFKKRDCTEAQVFKNTNGDKLVKWYNN